MFHGIVEKSQQHDKNIKRKCISADEKRFNETIGTVLVGYKKSFQTYCDDIGTANLMREMNSCNCRRNVHILAIAFLCNFISYSGLESMFECHPKVVYLCLKLIIISKSK